jgi:hypothetical protein
LDAAPVFLLTLALRSRTSRNSTAAIGQTATLVSIAGVALFGSLIRTIARNIGGVVPATF